MELKKSDKIEIRLNIPVIFKFLEQEKLTDSEMLMFSIENLEDIKETINAQIFESINQICGGDVKTNAGGWKDVAIPVVIWAFKEEE